MRYLVMVTLILVNLWAMESLALDVPMRFEIKRLGQNRNSLEKSVVWNPTTQEAMVRMGLVPTYVDPILTEKIINFATARAVEVVPLAYPELGEGCTEVSQWQFEYRPGLPDYLMYITLKGPNCQRLAEHLEVYNTRFRFIGLAQDLDPIDVSIEIVR